MSASPVFLMLFEEQKEADSARPEMQVLHLSLDRLISTPQAGYGTPKKGALLLVILIPLVPWSPWSPWSAGPLGPLVEGKGRKKRMDPGRK